MLFRKCMSLYARVANVLLCNPGKSLVEVIALALSYILELSFSLDTKTPIKVLEWPVLIVAVLGVVCHKLMKLITSKDTELSIHEMTLCIRNTYARECPVVTNRTHLVLTLTRTQVMTVMMTALNDRVAG